MRLSLIILLILFTSFNYGQHSDRYNQLVKDLKKIGSTTDTIYYKNGNIEWITTQTTYEYDSVLYRNYTGKQIHYYKNGQIISETLKDDYGNILNLRWYDRDGNKTYESILIEIDTRANSISEFFYGKNLWDFKRYDKEYKCSYKFDVCYLFREGLRINKKKKGLWKTYNADGTLKKEKEY